MTSLTRELGAEQDLDAFATTLVRAARRGLRARAGRDRRAGGTSLGRTNVGRHGMSDSGRAHPRHPLARQPRRRDRDRGPAVPRAQAAVAEGAGARRPDLPQAEEGDRGRQPAHRLRGGQLPERRRVLGARHRDLHDPRRRLHPPLRLLQRADGRPDLERPARAAAGRDPGEEDGPAPRGRHLGRPRRPARLRRLRLRRRDPLDPDDGPGVQGRGADARLPRPGDAAGEGDPRAPRRLQPQRRDGPAPLPAGPPRLRLPALVPRAAAWRRRWAASGS